MNEDGDGNLVSRRDLLSKATIVSVGGVIASLPGAGTALGKSTSKGSAPFKDSDEVYATVGAAIKTHVRKTNTSPLFNKERVRVGIILNDPPANIVIDLKDGKSTTEFDRRAESPDSAVSLSSATAHDLLSGRRNLAEVTAAGDINLIGDRKALAALTSFPDAARDAYRASLKSANRADLTRNWR